MERRTGSRAQVDLPVGAFVDGFRHTCRAVEISPRGMLVQRGKRLVGRGLRGVCRMDLHLEAGREIHLRGRTVWSDGPLQAVRFVVMDDVDRLDIAEHLDALARQARPLH